jgi:hypothetical protein
LKVWDVEASDQMDKLFSFAKRIDSHALLVNPQTINEGWVERFPTGQNPDKELTPNEKDIYDIYMKRNGATLIAKMAMALATQT